MYYFGATLSALCTAVNCLHASFQWDALPLPVAGRHRQPAQQQQGGLLPQARRYRAPARRNDLGRPSQSVPTAARGFAALKLGDDFGQPVEGDRAAELATLAVQRGVLTLADEDGDLCYGPPPIPSITQHLVDLHTRKLNQSDAIALAPAKLLKRACP